MLYQLSYTSIIGQEGFEPTPLAGHVLSVLRRANCILSQVNHTLEEIQTLIHSRDSFFDAPMYTNSTTSAQLHSRIILPDCNTISKRMMYSAYLNLCLILLYINSRCLIIPWLSFGSIIVGASVLREPKLIFGRLALTCTVY